jgi:hypothetical protein
MPADATTALARPLMFFRCSWERSGSDVASTLVVIRVMCGFPVDPVREDAPFVEIWGFPEIIKKMRIKQIQIQRYEFFCLYPIKCMVLLPNIYSTSYYQSFQNF